MSSPSAKDKNNSGSIVRNKDLGNTFRTNSENSDSHTALTIMGENLRAKLDDEEAGLRFDSFSKECAAWFLMYCFFGVSNSLSNMVAVEHMTPEGNTVVVPNPAEEPILVAVFTTTVCWMLWTTIGFYNAFMALMLPRVPNKISNVVNTVLVLILTWLAFTLFLTIQAIRATEGDGGFFVPFLDPLYLSRQGNVMNATTSAALLTQDAHYLGAAAFLTIFAYGAVIGGGPFFFQFALLRIQCDRSHIYTRSYFLKRIVYYGFLCSLAGVGQLLAGGYTLYRFGSEPAPGDAPYNLTLFSFRYPSLALLVGAYFVVWGIIVMLMPLSPARLLLPVLFTCGFAYLLIVSVQVYAQGDYLAIGTGIALPIMPSYLAVRAALTPVTFSEKAFAVKRRKLEVGVGQAFVNH